MSNLRFGPSVVIVVVVVVVVVLVHEGAVVHAGKKNARSQVARSKPGVRCEYQSFYLWLKCTKQTSRKLSSEVEGN